MLLELAAVLLVTALAFAWGRQVAQAERGYNAIGGEHLLALSANKPCIFKQFTAFDFQ